MKFTGLLLMAVTLYAAAPEGIPRALAIERARRVSDVRYRLHFDLLAHADLMQARETLTFSLSDNTRDLLIDFREGTLKSMIVNGTVVPGAIDNGHINLAAQYLHQGANKIEFDFTAPVAPAGKAITRYEDKDDGNEYIYSLFVPMDASMAFPCFDQPDLKARFTLELTHPAEWSVISNVALGAETQPISTYLFAFAAGPFQKVHPALYQPDVYVRKSQVARAEQEVPQIQQITVDGMKYLSDYFAQPFPFPKYDMVLIPGFPFGGMEHAGATFLNEDAMLFRSAPTETDRFARNITVLHELTHQWFGDFTTMRWFDDLWLKEGFATYMAYHAMDEISSQPDTWAKFYQQIKPAAYAIDITQGTTPIYQDIPNLKDAKSAYGAIVYSKAPGVLRQLEFLLGADKFRDGLRIYLATHAYGNADWNDLIHALEKASGTSLTDWAEAWIQHRGLPVVTAEWSCSNARLDSLTLYQTNAIPEARTWPIATEILLGYKDARQVKLSAQFSGASYKVGGAAGKLCPDYVFANNDDHAYGIFLPDEKSLKGMTEALRYEKDLFLRTMLWGALYDSVHFAQLNPRDYLAAVLSELPSEQDETLVRSIAARSVHMLHFYVSDAALSANFESLAFQRMKNAPTNGLRIVWFRTFVDVAESPESLGQIKNLLLKRVLIEGVEFRPLDRWRMVTALLAQADPDALSFFAAERNRDQSGIGQKYAYTAVAARAALSNKRFYFDDYLHNSARPEDWVQDSLASFNFWNQSDVTLPYLRQSLDALPQVKQQRKIFFLMAWLNAFIGGQHSLEASHEVYSWLAANHPDPDLRLKILQVLDELDRKVQIRQRFQ